jgi:hypothetical protein
MTSKERVLTAIRGGQPDRVPIDILPNRWVEERLHGDLGTQTHRELLERLHCDIVVQTDVPTDNIIAMVEASLEGGSFR